MCKKRISASRVIHVRVPKATLELAGKFIPSNYQSLSELVRVAIKELLFEELRAKKLAEGLGKIENIELET